jgi:hypothetical protein
MDETNLEMMSRWIARENDILKCPSLGCGPARPAGPHDDGIGGSTDATYSNRQTPKVLAIVEGGTLSLAG